MDAALSSRLHRAAGRPWQCSKALCRDCARYLIEQRQASNRIPGGATFSLRHSGANACGIPDGETLILTGGDGHNFVTRWVHEHEDRNSFSYGHEDANYENPHTFEKQMWETAQKYAPDFDPFTSVPCTSKGYRYNVNGFVEELPQLPENRNAHACAALPATGVRPDQPTC